MSRNVSLLLPLCGLLSCARDATPSLTPAEAERPSESLEGASAPVAGSWMALIAQDRRQFEEGMPGVLTATLPGVLRAELRSEGLSATTGSDELGLRTVAYGAFVLEGTIPQLGACAPTSEVVGGRCAPAAELAYGPVTEWWTSSEQGLHQGWTLHLPSDGPALLRVAPSVGALDSVDVDGQGAWFSGSSGALWRYDALSAWDASGRRLSAWMAEDKGALWIRVDTEGARWPVTVDPLLGPVTSSEDKVSASDGAADDYLGFSVRHAGDVDGDGYDDVIVGAYADDDGGSKSGSAYVYYGSASGIDASTEDKLVASDAAADDNFGYVVATAGDVNGDGYDDVLVGAFRDDDTASGSGSVYLYYGGSSGVRSSSEDKLNASDAAASDSFGISVSAAGDVDGDGYDDVIIGAHADDDGGSASGSAYLYYGSVGGLDLASEDKLTASDGASSDYFGYAVANAGDVDGDGYDDVIVGARGDDDSGSDGGSAYLYYGSASGIDSSSEDKITASDGAADDHFGFSVAGAGDLDSDGYDDVILGAWGHDHDGAESGSAYVYYGSASGIDASSEEELRATDAASADYLGFSVSGAGDLDGDGYDDVVVGAAGDDDSGADSGSVYVFYGTSSGISISSGEKFTASDGAASSALGYSVSGGGDLDGDGYPDLIAGAYKDDDLASNSGAIYVFSARSRVRASDRASSDFFAWSVSDAGDVNGDGYDDILIGARGDESSTGAAYLYYGSASGVDASTEDKLTASDGASGDYFGSAVSAAGDVDSDGYDDVVIGAFGDDDNGSDSGSIYLIYGSGSGIAPATEQKLSASDGAKNDFYGGEVSAAGDVDGDGYDDVVVGAHGGDDNGDASGTAYLYYGTSTGLSASSELKLTASDGASLDGFGRPVAGVGDVNGDGYDDLLIGARGDGSYTGAAYVYLGSSSGLAPSTELKLTASDGSISDYFAAALSGVGDVDGDGYDDVLVGSLGDDDDGSGSGSAYLYYGSSTGVSLSSEARLTASDATTTDYFGDSVSGAGDLDGDGYDDLIVGASGVGSYAGAAYVYYGSISGVDSSTEDKLQAVDGSSRDRFTNSVSSAGDVNGDGYDDLLVGAPYDDSNRGSVHVYSGGCRDLDGDGACGDADCDESDASVYATAPEIVGDEVDSDCDGGEICYADADDDGYTDGSTTITSTDEDCSDSGEGTASDPTGECDDSDSAVNPGATEAVGDGVDSDCDGGEICYVDADEDGYTDGSTTVTSADEDCRDTGEGKDSDATGECDDSDSAVNPGASEAVGDELDSDCDGEELCYVDADDDGYVDGTSTVISTDEDCSDTGEGTASDPGGECDDSDPAVNPGASETVGDELDSDCDGEELCYADADDDGYVDGSTVVVSGDSSCSDPGEGTATDPVGECDDGDAAVNPGATEAIGDDLDSDCDGGELCYADLDDDGYIDGSSTVVSDDEDCGDPGEGRSDDPTGECDDTNASINPTATEICDEGDVDEDCSGAADDADPGVDSTTTSTWYADADADGYGDLAAPVQACDLPEGAVDDAGDCDDTRSDVNPAGVEVCDEANVDEDCSGAADDADPGVDLSTASTAYSDADGDGYGDFSAPSIACDQPTGTVSDATDCDDGDADISPGALELPDDGVDQDCDGVDAEAPEEGCGGCSQSGSRGGGLGLLLLLSLVSRRRSVRRSVR